MCSVIVINNMIKYFPLVVVQRDLVGFDQTVLITYIMLLSSNQMTCCPFAVV